MENLIISINCVIPVFIMICTGAMIRTVYQVPKEFFDRLSTLCFQVLLPFMLFDNICAADLSTSFDPKLLLFLGVGVVGWFVIGYGLLTFLVPDPKVRGTYIQCWFRSNIGVVGVAMARSMMDDAGVATVTMAVALLAPLYNVLAIVALETCRGGKVNLKHALVSIAKNNIVRSCLLGILFLLLDVPVPSAIMKGIGSVGDAGSVMTMVALGASLRFDGMRSNRKRVSVGVLLRLVVAPLAFTSAAVLLGFRGNALGAVLLTSASPMASTSYAMALACDSDHELTGQLVVTTSFFCCLTLFLWIFFYKQMGML